MPNCRQQYMALQTAVILLLAVVVAVFTVVLASVSLQYAAVAFALAVVSHDTCPHSVSRHPSGAVVAVAAVLLSLLFPLV